MWQQIYDPFGNLFISAFAAILPILFFLLALTVLKMKGIIASFLTLAVSFIVAVFFFTCRLRKLSQPFYLELQTVFGRSDILS